MDLERKIVLLSNVSLSNGSAPNEVKTAKRKIKLLRKRIIKATEVRIAEKKKWNAEQDERDRIEREERVARSKAESEAIMAAWKNSVAVEPLDVDFFNQNNHWQGKK